MRRTWSQYIPESSTLDLIEHLFQEPCAMPPPPPPGIFFANFCAFAEFISSMALQGAKTCQRQASICWQVARQSGIPRGPASIEALSSQRSQGPRASQGSIQDLPNSPRRWHIPCACPVHCSLQALTTLVISSCSLSLRISSLSDSLFIFADYLAKITRRHRQDFCFQLPSLLENLRNQAFKAFTIG